jgi:hypothetical protein
MDETVPAPGRLDARGRLRIAGMSVADGEGDPAVSSLLDRLSEFRQM